MGESLGFQRQFFSVAAYQGASGLRFGDIAYHALTPGIALTASWAVSGTVNSSS